MSFKSVCLFGEAMFVDLPATYGDVSEIRQVPDNQEVYLDARGFGSIAVELLERVDKDDTDALQHHVQELIAEDASQAKVMTWSDAIFAKLPAGSPAYTISATAPAGEKQRGRANEPDFVLLHVILLRLVEQATDVMISINTPFIAGQYDKNAINIETGIFGPLAAAAISYRDRILQTFEIKDWDLFVNDQKS